MRQGELDIEKLAKSMTHDFAPLPHRNLCDMSTGWLFSSLSLHQGSIYGLGIMRPACRLYIAGEERRGSSENSNDRHTCGIKIGTFS